LNFKDGVLVALHVNKWSAAKKLDPSDLGLSPDQVPEFMKLGKKMLIPEEEKTKFTQIENNARNSLERDSFAFPVGGARFVPRHMILTVDHRLKAYQREFQEAVDSFLLRYNEIREDMLTRYEEHRDKLEPYYPGPNSISRFFSFSWVVFEIGEMSLKAGETAEAYEEFKRTLREQFNQFLQDAVIDLRFQVQETCLRVAERVAKGEIVNGNSLKSIHNVIDKFMNLNFVGDVRIEKQLNDLRASLQGVKAEELKENETLRKELGTAAAQIAKDAADISDVDEVTGEYKRKLNLEDNEQEVKAA
jgi:hypothetical protein